MIVPRLRALARIARSFRVHPAVALLGPRQCGKTTLAREFVAGQSEWTFFDLESAVGRRKLASPEEELGRRTGLVVIDEVQREPAVFEALRVLVDRPDSETRFLLLGSASPDLVRGASETLAGRLGFVNLSGFDLSEVGRQPCGGRSAGMAAALGAWRFSAQLPRNRRRTLGGLAGRLRDELP